MLAVSKTQARPEIKELEARDGGERLSVRASLGMWVLLSSLGWAGIVSAVVLIV